MSSMRKVYMGRFVGRCLALVAVTFLMFTAPEQFDVLEKGGFFQKLSLLHLLWAVWLVDMLTQLVPATKAVVALGSQKSFLKHFRPALPPITAHSLRERMVRATKRAYIVFVIWAILIAALGILYGKKIIGDLGLFWISCLFYVCDLICVLFWCPFRHFIMKNRCCTTCRIFNWDYIMMCTPLMVLKGPLVLSACILSVILLIRWEVTHLRHPHRFYESSNRSMRCNECQEHLCKYKRALQTSCKSK